MTSNKPSKTHRVNVELNPDEYEKLRVLAHDEARSMTNFTTLVVRRYIRETWERRTSATDGTDGDMN